MLPQPPSPAGEGLVWAKRERESINFCEDVHFLFFARESSILFSVPSVFLFLQFLYLSLSPQRSLSPGLFLGVAVHPCGLSPASQALVWLCQSLGLSGLYFCPRMLPHFKQESGRRAGGSLTLVYMGSLTVMNEGLGQSAPLEAKLGGGERSCFPFRTVWGLVINLFPGRASCLGILTPC